MKGAQPDARERGPRLNTHLDVIQLFLDKSFVLKSAYVLQCSAHRLLKVWCFSIAPHGLSGFQSGKGGCKILQSLPSVTSISAGFEKPWIQGHPLQALAITLKWSSVFRIKKLNTI